ncbi:MAG TPA: CHAD domain-containing protein [Solirubrobacteraceae bacterium]|nr:CHAD domain-containing protein [Solirubrobacteraceae bacterium]
MGTAVVKAKVDVPLAYDQRADVAASAVLRRLLGVIGENTEGAISGEDPEHLHQLRIAVRRSRTVQRQLKDVFSPTELPGFRAEFRWLQQATGPARDLDVYLEDLDSLREMLPEAMRGDLDPLVPVLGHSRLAARADMTRALRSVRACELFEDWDRLLETMVERSANDRPAAARPIGPVAGKRIRKVYKRILAMGRAIDAASPAEDYHELRKKGKELRYLLELFGVKLFDEETVTPFVKSLKGLQDLLGRHQDREVQIAMLRSSVEEVSTLPGGGAACMAMGALVERLRVDERAARDEFAERFAELSAKSQRALVRETFR